jgi:hypothetical protein
MIMKWKHRKDICLILIIPDDKMVSTRIRGQDVEKPKLVSDYNFGMGCVDLIDAYLTSCCSTRKMLKEKNYMKSSSVI